MASTPNGLRDWSATPILPPRSGVAMAAVTPTLAVSSGPLSPTASEEEMEASVRSGSGGIGRRRRRLLDNDAGCSSPSMDSASSSKESAKCGSSSSRKPVLSSTPVLPPPSESNNAVEIIKLQCQLEQLTQLVQSSTMMRVGGAAAAADGCTAPSAADSGAAAAAAAAAAEIARLQEENAHLHETVGIADQRLTALAVHEQELESRFAKEMASFKSQLSECQEAAENAVRQKNEWARNYEKVAKSKAVLESYIQGLPSQDEFDSFKSSLSVKSESQKRAETKMQTLEAENIQLRNQHFKATDNKRRLELQVNDLKMRLAEAEGLNKAHSDRLSKAKEATSRSSGGGRAGRGHDLEVLMEENDVLQVENNKLKKYVKLQQQKYEKRGEELSAKLVAKTQECDSLGLELARKSEICQQEKDTSTHLRQQISDKIVSVSALRKKLEILESEVAVWRNSEAIDQDVVKIRSRVAKKLRRCVNDMQSLAKVSKQLVVGQNPNVSMLLGIEHDDVTSAARGATTDDVTTTKQRELRGLESDLESLEETGQAIADLRQILTDKYADSCAQNCHVQ